MNFVRAFRPKRFRSQLGHIGVLGQDEVVSELIAEVRSRRGRSILLHGPHLSGKETLARIYANALLCTHSSDGEPCLDDEECSSCCDFQDGDHRNFRHVTGDEPEGDLISALTANCEIDHLSDGWMVILITNADELSDHALGVLQRRLKAAPEKLAFIVCTRQPEALPETLRSGLLELRTQPVSVPLRLSLLEAVCRGESPYPHGPIEPGSLELLAECSSPALGRVLNALQAVLSDEGVTLARVRAHFRLDGDLPSARYLSALLNGEPLAAQISLLAASDATPGERIGAIEALLAGLYAADIEHIPQESMHLTSLTPAQRSGIVTGLERRAEALGFEPRRFWPHLIAVWRPDPSASEASLFARAAEFRNFLDEQKGPPSRNRFDLKDKPTRRRVRSKANEVDDINEVDVYLSRRQVEDLWNAAAFGLQTSGQYLNTYIVMEHDTLGINNEVAAQKLVTDFLSELGKKMHSRKRRQGDDRGITWLYVHERDSEQRLRTCIALYLPKTMRDVETWLRTRFLARRCGGPVKGDAVIVRLEPDRPAKAVRRHMTLLRLISRGLDPKVKIVTSRRGSDEERSLIDVIGVPKMLRRGVGTLSTIRRWETSRHCSKEARKQEDSVGLPFVSATTMILWSGKPALGRRKSWSRPNANSRATAMLDGWQSVRSANSRSENAMWKAPRRD
jgi:hypothetical protein